MKSLIAVKITVRPSLKASAEIKNKLRGFVRQQSYDIYDDGSQWYAVIYDGEGEDVKTALRYSGFKDTDFSINVE